MPSASLRALVARAIDYAGLFPPASLALEPALRNHAQYVRLPDAWMLGAFILPPGQFDGAVESLSQFEKQNPLRISALGPKTENAIGFLDALETMMPAVSALVSRHSEVLTVTQLEMPLPEQADAALLANARAITGELPAFLEASPDAAGRTIVLLAEHNASVSSRPMGYKLRTGGVTASAFPTSPQIANALVASAKHHVPIKFTAGLHHPIRKFHSSVETRMHGFLNVLGAGVLAAEHGWDAPQIVRMLEDEDPGSFAFDDKQFAWREWKIETDRIDGRRELVTSLGSCSFDEPREDLRALNFL